MSLQPTAGVIPQTVNLNAIVEFTPDVEVGAVAHGLIDESPKASTRLWLGGRRRHLIFCVRSESAMMLHFAPNGGWRKLDGAEFTAEYEQDAETRDWRRKDGGNIVTGPVAKVVLEAPPAPGAVKLVISGKEPQRAQAAGSERRERDVAPSLPPSSVPAATLPPGLGERAPAVASPSAELDEMFGGPKSGIGDLSGLPTARSAVGVSYPPGSAIPANVSQVDLSAALSSRTAGPLRDEIGKGLWDAVLPRALEIEKRDKARDTTMTALSARMSKLGKAS